MIQYRDWYIWTQGQVVARQFDHMTRSLEVTGELPEGWEWTAIVRVGDYMDYLPLTLTRTGAAITLTAQQLSLAGMYSIQLRGKQGELVRHTNVLSVYVPASLSGDSHWPELPSEFTQLEQRVFTVGEQAEESARQAQNTALQVDEVMETVAQAKAETEQAAVAAAQSAAGADASERAAQEHRTEAEAAAALAESHTAHPPMVGENGNWWLWNGTQYADSGKHSRGELTRAQANALYTNALRSRASGTIVRMDDVSPLEHSVTVNVSGVDDPAAVMVYQHCKNLIPYPYYNTTKTVQGITFTDNGDGTVTANGTATGSATFLTINTNDPMPIKAGTYTLSGCPVGGDNSKKYSFVVGWRQTSALDGRVTFSDIGEGAVCTFEEDGYYDTVLVVRAGCTVDNLVFKPMLELGTKRTGYEPYVEPVAYPVSEDGICEVTSISPTMTLTTDTEGVVMDCECNRDINKAFEQLQQAIISMGGNV